MISAGVHTPTAKTQDALHGKHPQTGAQRDPVFDTPAVGTHFPPHTEHRPFTTSDVRRAIQKTAPATSAGGTGLSFQHLKELIRRDGTDPNRWLGRALAQFAGHVARGELPELSSAWFAGAPLTPLRKRDGGVRPIAVGETLRRLVGMLLNGRVALRARALLSPSQLGVATPGGSEAIVHAVRHRIALHGDDDRIALLKLDFCNAFNLINRDAIMRTVRVHFPELYGYVHTCYAREEDPFLWCGELLLRSRTGCQQGDPLGPLLFSLVLYDLLSTAPPLPPSEEDGTCALACRFMFYLDDGLAIGPHAALQHYLTFLSSPTASSHGLHLSMEKCKVWGPTASELETWCAYSCDIAQSYTASTRIMQVPVGGGEQVTEQLLDDVRSLKPYFAALAEIEDAHVAVTLLRSCFSSCRVMYWLRVTPPRCAASAAALFDMYVAEAFRDLVGGDVADDFMPELHLPVRSTHPNFGVGLSSAVAVAPAAYLPSSSLVQTIPQHFTPYLSQTPLSSHSEILEAVADWHSRIAEDKRMSAHELLDSSPRQKTLTAPVFDEIFTRIPRGNLRRRAHRASLGLPHAKAWLSCPPSPSLRTHIAGRDFRVSMRYHCHLPLFDSSFECPRRGCSVQVGMYGDHLFHCRKGVNNSNAPVLWRHDSFVHELASVLRQANLSP